LGTAILLPQFTQLQTGTGQSADVERVNNIGIRLPLIVFLEAPVIHVRVLF